jgi:PPM family protein phosphatase
VFDGMGGMASGDVAANAGATALGEVLGELLPHATTDELPVALSLAVARARLAIAALSVDSRHRGTGSTVAAVLLDGQRAVVAHVGDSRVYRLRAGRLEALTRDHSLYNEVVSSRIHLSEPFPEHLRNVITRALGFLDGELVVDTRVELVEVGDVFLVCTDGVHGVVDDEAMAGILGEALARGDDGARALVAAAIAAGGEDNATAVVVPGGRSPRRTC